jgi:hypothetical protein
MTVVAQSGNKPTSERVLIRWAEASGKRSKHLKVLPSGSDPQFHSLKREWSAEPRSTSPPTQTFVLVARYGQLAELPVSSSATTDFAEGLYNELSASSLRARADRWAVFKPDNFTANFTAMSVEQAPNRIFCSSYVYLSTTESGHVGRVGFSTGLAWLPKARSVPFF